MIWIGGDNDHKHDDCVLCKLDDPERTCSVTYGPDVSDAERDAGLAAVVYWSWAKPGTFKFLAKWQAGHYNHAEIGNMKFEIYGVGLGSRTMPLESWVTVATITITKEFEVWVNGVKGTVNGSAPHMEK